MDGRFSLDNLTYNIYPNCRVDVYSLALKNQFNIGEFQIAFYKAVN